MYRLTVEKSVKNESLTKEDLERLKNQGPFQGFIGQAILRKESYSEFMTIILTDEEFAAVKKAVLGVM